MRAFEVDSGAEKLDRAYFGAEARFDGKIGIDGVNCFDFADHGAVEDGGPCIN